MAAFFLVLNKYFLIWGEKQKPHRISAVLPRILRQPINIPESESETCFCCPAACWLPLRRVSGHKLCLGERKGETAAKIIKSSSSGAQSRAASASNPRLAAKKFTAAHVRGCQGGGRQSIVFRKQQTLQEEAGRRHKGWSSLSFRGNTDRFSYNLRLCRRNASVRLNELQLHQAFSANGGTFTGKDADSRDCR